MSLNFTINEDIPALSDVQRIPLEGNRIDRPRNVRRIVVETATDSSGGAVVGGYRIEGAKTDFNRFRPLDPVNVTPVPTQIEIYADQLPHILTRVRTEEHVQLMEQAKMIADRKNAVWIESQSRYLDMLDEAERQRVIYLKQPTHWQGELCVLGVRGVPPLLHCHVLHPQTGERMDAREWLSLPVEERVSWTLDAPATQQNQQEKAADHMADVIARAFEKMNERAEGSRARK